MVVVTELIIFCLLTNQPEITFCSCISFSTSYYPARRPSIYIALLPSCYRKPFAEESGSCSTCIGVIVTPSNSFRFILFCFDTIRDTHSQFYFIFSVSLLSVLRYSCTEFVSSHFTPVLYL